MSNKQRFILVDKLQELRRTIITETSRMSVTADTSGMAEVLFTTYIKPILDLYQPVISPLASHNSDTLYRARKCVGEYPFNELKELYNPPTPSGRAYTSENIPIFYASSSMQTCLSELDPKIGELINVAHFNYSRLKGGDFWFVGQLGSFHKSNEPSRYLHNKSAVEKPFYYPEEALHSWVFKDSLINEIFSELSTDTDNYALNRFLIYEISKMLSKEIDFHGVVFLSVKDPPGTNFAIFGDAIGQLEPGIVNLVKITDIDSYGFVAFKLLKNTKPINEALVWPKYELRSD